MGYINLINWTDLEKNKEYTVNQPYDSEGASEKRLASLLSPYNPIGRPIIRWVDEPALEDKVEAVRTPQEDEPLVISGISEKNSVEEIKTYLTSKGIEFHSGAKKAELLGLVKQ